MAVLKRKSIPSGTLKLKQLKNTSDFVRGEYMYVIEFPDGDRIGPLDTKQNAKKRFESVVDTRTQGTNGGGLFGGLF